MAQGRPPLDPPCDAVVVGGGAARLSAATWLGRYRRSALVVDSGEYRNRWCPPPTGTSAGLGVVPPGPEDELSS